MSNYNIEKQAVKNVNLKMLEGKHTGRSASTGTKTSTEQKLLQLKTNQTLLDDVAKPRAHLTVVSPV